MKGIHFNAVPVDEALVKSLNPNHMEQLAVVPKTVMATVLQPGEPWLRMDSNYPSQMTERFNILANHHDKVIAGYTDPYTRAAEIELRNKVVSSLLTEWPQYFNRKGKNVSSPVTGVAVDLAEAHPMDALAVLTNADLLLMLPTQRLGLKSKQQQRVYRLRSGILAFPNGWSLFSHFNKPEPSALDHEAHDRWKAERDESLRAARMGKSVIEIHRGVVPHFDAYFRDPVNRMFNAMQPGRVVWRRNWGLPISDNLLRHADMEDSRDIHELTPENMLAHGNIRSEHETFLRLPGSKAIVFGIQTYIWPMREVLANPATYEAVTTARANLSPEMFQYREESMKTLDKVLANYPRPVAAP